MGLFSRRAELFEFAYGVARFRYTSGSRAIDWNAGTYASAPIQRGAIHESDDPSRNTLDLTVPLSLPLLDLFRPVSPMAPITVAVYRQNINGSTGGIWNGDVGSVEFSGAQAVIHCLPPMASLQATGLKRAWQKQCPLTLYSAGLGACNASREAVKADAAITGVAGNVVHAAAFAAQADGWWAGGYLEWNDGAIMQRRFITDHAGDAVTLLTPATPLVPGMTVTALPGCDHTLATCDAKFHNAVNYGGQPWIPVKNPMGNKEVF